ncbi:MAG: helix-turn-helix transcriptional regulator [Gammaproteobacteria bacterium]|nr:helix-turn-helix transcriptional regulator [Gammaproteobacteria bacterium]
MTKVIEKEISTLLNCIQFPIIILKTDFSILEINKPALNIYGWQYQNSINKNIFSLCQITNCMPPVTIETLTISLSLAKSNISFKNSTLFNPEAPAKWDVFCSDNIIDDEKVFVLGAHVLNNNLLGLFQKDNFEHLLSRSMFSLLRHTSLATKNAVLHEGMVDFQQISFNSNTLLDEIIKLLPGDVYWENRDLKYLGCNDYCAEVIGLDSPRDIINKDDAFVKKLMGKNYPKEGYGLWQKTSRAVMQNNKALINMKDFTLNHMGTGEALLLRTSKVPIVDSSGEVVGIVGMSYGQNVPEHIQQVLKADIALQKIIDADAHKNILTTLSSREFECVEYRAKGKPVKQIAQELNLSPRTVETHLNNAKLKTNSATSGQLTNLYWDYCGNNTNLENAFC